MLNRIQTRPVFQRLVFAQSFEDPEPDRRALQIRPEHHVLCITSGGCNALALLLDEPARLIALDMNEAQSALLKLKIESIRRLDYDEFLELLGLRPSTRRQTIYLKLPAIPFFDKRIEVIEEGVLNAGRFEQYLKMFRCAMRVLQGRHAIEELLKPRGCEERLRFYDEVWDTPQWRAFSRIFFSRQVLGRLGLDPEFFTFVNGTASFGKLFLSRARHALVDLPVEDNFFVEYILTGTYRRAFPPYLQKGNFERLRSLIDRVQIVTAEVGDFLRSLPENHLDRIDFSNIFEWLDPAACERLLREVVRVCKPGARMTYRNLLVHRERPEALKDFIRPDPMARQMLQFDRSFVYANFVVEEIVKEAPCRSVA